MLSKALFDKLNNDKSHIPKCIYIEYNLHIIDVEQKNNQVQYTVNESYYQLKIINMHQRIA